MFAVLNHFRAGPKDIRRRIQGVLIESHPDGARLTATDGYILGTVTTATLGAWTHPPTIVPPALAGTSAADRACILRGAQWLINRTQGGREFPPTPIGFYFAKLWYWENLYPVVWAVAALRAVEQWQQEK